MGSQEKGLEHLELWQVAMVFAQKVCQEIVPALPLEEKWVMATQLRRAVQSVSANIAEGYGRFYYQDNIRFCYIARGSLEETFNYLFLANRLGYVSSDQYSHLFTEINRLRKLLNGYIAYLKASKRGASEPGAGFVVREYDNHYGLDETPDLDSDTQDVDPKSPFTNH